MLDTFSLSEPCSSKEDENRGRRDFQSYLITHSYAHSFSQLLQGIHPEQAQPVVSPLSPQKTLTLWSCWRFISRSHCKDFFVQPLPLLLIMLPWESHPPPQSLAYNTQENDHLPPSLSQTTVGEIRKTASAHYWLFLSQWSLIGTQIPPRLKTGFDRATH